MSKLKKIFLALIIGLSFSLLGTDETQAATKSDGKEFRYLVFSAVTNEPIGGNARMNYAIDYFSGTQYVTTTDHRTQIAADGPLLALSSWASASFIRNGSTLEIKQLSPRSCSGGTCMTGDVFFYKGSSEQGGPYLKSGLEIRMTHTIVLDSSFYTGVISNNMTASNF